VIAPAIAPILARRWINDKLKGCYCGKKGLTCDTLFLLSLLLTVLYWELSMYATVRNFSEA
jgi:hypothetical protein